MTDRTPASPVEVLLEDAVAAVRYAADKLPGSGSRMTQAAEYRIREAVDLLDAALQAQDHTITKGGLDVERLERAYLRVIDVRPATVEVTFPRADVPVEFQRQAFLRSIAREYAALEPTHD